MSQLANIQYKEEELVVCKNGLIDLRSGKLVPPGLVHNVVTHNHMLNINYKSPADLKPEMEEEFLDYLKKLLPAENTRRDVFEFLWLSLSGYESRVIQCHWGHCAGGKTTFFNAVNYLFGSYCGFGDPEILNNDEIFNVGNKRLIIFDDLSGVISVSKLKSIVGEKIVRTRKIYCDAEEYRMNVKIIFVANNNLEFSDPSFWKRLKFIPWMTYFYDPKISSHPMETVEKLYKYPMDPYYKTEAWFDAMGPYFLNLVLDYGKNVVSRMSDQQNVGDGVTIKEVEEVVMNIVDNGEEENYYDGQEIYNVEKVVEDNIFEEKLCENEQENVAVVDKVIDEEKPTMVE